MAHSNQLREFVLTDHGIEIARRVHRARRSVDRIVAPGPGSPGEGRTDSAEGGNRGQAAGASAGATGIRGHNRGDSIGVPGEGRRASSCHCRRGGSRATARPVANGNGPFAKSGFRWELSQTRRRGMSLLRRRPFCQSTEKSHEHNGTPGQSFGVRRTARARRTMGTSAVRGRTHAEERCRLREPQADLRGTHEGAISRRGD